MRAHVPTTHMPQIQTLSAHLYSPRLLPLPVSCHCPPLSQLEVWSVAFANLLRSPVHDACLAAVPSHRHRPSVLFSPSLPRCLPPPVLDSLLHARHRIHVQGVTRAAALQRPPTTIVCHPPCLVLNGHAIRAAPVLGSLPRYRDHRAWLLGSRMRAKPGHKDELDQVDKWQNPAWVYFF
jgi:hypothetical protein